MSNKYVSVPKKVHKLLVGLMEAIVCESLPEAFHCFCYIEAEGLYVGEFNRDVVLQLEKQGIAQMKATQCGEVAIELINRDDFLSSWEDGVKQARNGSDTYYADYNSCPLAFTAGYQHYQNRKKTTQPYSYAAKYYCHGFVCDDTGEVFKQ